MAKRTTGKTVAALTHGDASRKNIPTAEYQAVMAADDRSPIEVAYERRNRDLDPQLVWRGKDAQDWSDLVVQAPPLFIQEKVHPKVLIDDLRRRSKEGAAGNADDAITREPEQVKAFRDTWRDGIHSYLTYLRDRLTVARDLLTESGSIFVQIGDENVHRVRAVMDEVFGEENFISEIAFQKTPSTSSESLSGVFDLLLWYGKSMTRKHRPLFQVKEFGGAGATQYSFAENADGLRRPLAEWDELSVDRKVLQVFAHGDITSQRPAQGEDVRSFIYEGKSFELAKGTFKTDARGLGRISRTKRMIFIGNSLRYVRFLDDFKIFPFSNLWTDTTTSGFADPKVYVVQTNRSVVERCILMTTDPGDLVLDPTCGSGTTAYVAEQWGRRWITIDTSRVALALARARVMGARYPWYLLADSRDGQLKEADIARKAPADAPTYSDIRHGFVYERVPHVTLKSIANNAEIDVIWEKWQETIQPLLSQLDAIVGATGAGMAPLPEWEIPRDLPDDWPPEATPLHEQFWTARIARQREIDASIAAKADYETLYDKPYEDNKKVRVAGPFTVESLSPHRLLGVDENDELIDNIAEDKLGYGGTQDFAGMLLEHLKTAGVQQAHKDDRITFAALKPWPGHHVCAEGRYVEGDADSGVEKRAGIFIGPEFGTVSRPDLVEAVREAADLKNTGHGNLFVIFGEPDIDILDADNGQLQVKINGVDVFHPNTGEIRSDNADGIACWFVDTDYNEESFFVRHAYFLGANDPYKALKTTLKAENQRGGLGNAAQRHVTPVRQAAIRPHRREGNQPSGGRGDEGVQI